MARKIYKSAQGKVVDMDSLVSSNEHVVALGNMNVNARGDEIGSGGGVVKGRGQVMKEYYDTGSSKLNTPVAKDLTSKIQAERQRARDERKQVIAQTTKQSKEK